MTSIITSTIIEVLVAAAIIIGLIYEKEIIKAEDKLFRFLSCARKARKSSDKSLGNAARSQRHREREFSYSYEMLLNEYDKPHLKVINGGGVKKSSAAEVA